MAHVVHQVHVSDVHSKCSYGSSSIQRHCRQWYCKEGEVCYVLREWMNHSCSICICPHPQQIVKLINVKIKRGGVGGVVICMILKKLARLRGWRRTGDRLSDNGRMMMRMIARVKEMVV